MRKKDEHFSLLIIYFLAIFKLFSFVSTQSIEFNYTRRPSNNPMNNFFYKLDNSTQIKQLKNEFYLQSQYITENFLDFPFLSFGTELPLVNSINDEMIVNLCLGTPSQCFNVLIDSGSFVLWVTNIYSSDTPDAINKFDFNKSTTFYNTNKPYNIQYGTGSAEGYITKDVISLGKSRLPNFNFILIDKEEGHNGLDGILGLGYNYEDFDYGLLEFSIIDKLHSENLIKRKIFTQKYNDDETGSMVIGDLPDEISKDMHNYGNCPLIRKDGRRKNPMWQCEMQLINFGETQNDIIIVKQPALFDTGTNLIVAPYNFLLKIFQNYFNHPNVKGNCILDSPEDRFYSIICNRLARVQTLPSLYFVFGEWALMMRPHEMFFRFPDNTIRFVISSDPTLNEWIIGEPLLKKFHMVFDKENHVIGFYGKHDKVKYTGHLPQPEDINYYDILIYFLLICAALIIIAFLIWVITNIINYFKRNSIVSSDVRYQAFRGNNNF